MFIDDTKSGFESISLCNEYKENIQTPEMTWLVY